MRFFRTHKLSRHKHTQFVGVHLPHPLDCTCDAVLPGRKHEVHAKTADQFIALHAHVFGHDDAYLGSFQPADKCDADARVV